jgi:hypothetical protein
VKRAVEQGDVKFFELGALSVEPKVEKRQLTLKLMEYPKRAQSPEDRVQVVDLDPVPTTFAVASVP